MADRREDAAHQIRPDINLRGADRWVYDDLRAIVSVIGSDTGKPEEKFGLAGLEGRCGGAGKGERCRSFAESNLDRYSIARQRYYWQFGQQQISYIKEWTDPVAVQASYLLSPGRCIFRRMACAHTSQDYRSTRREQVHFSLFSSRVRAKAGKRFMVFRTDFCEIESTLFSLFRQMMQA